MTRLPSGSSSAIRAIRITDCPTCGAANPDPANSGICQTCGSLFLQRVNKRLRGVLYGLAAGAIVFGAGVGLAWLHPAGMLVAAAGLFVLVATAGLGLKRVAQTLMTALSLRSDQEALRLLNRADWLYGGLLCILIVAGIILVPLSGRLSKLKQEQKWRKAEPSRQKVNEIFQDQLSTYASLLDAAGTSLDPIGDTPPPISKVVVIDVETDGARISTVHVLLPPNVLAETPGDVNYVVGLSWQPARSGDNQQSGDCTVTILDKTGFPSRTIGRKKISAADPEKVIEYLTSNWQRPKT